MTIARVLLITLACAGSLWGQALAATAQTAAPIPAPATPRSDGPEFPRLVKAYAGQLATLSSDADALSLFASKIGPAAGLPDVSAVLKQNPKAQNPIPVSTLQAVQRSAVRFTAALTRWQLTQALRAGLESGEDPPAKDVWAERQPQLGWLAAHDPAPAVDKLRPFLEADEWARSLPGAEVEHPGYEGYRAAVDRAYPDGVGTDTAWLPAIEQGGATVLKQRLISEAVGVPVPESVRPQMAARYVAQRLRPLLEARLQALMAEAERDAALQTYAEWTKLRAARDLMREAVGLKRLCGSWQWTTHNHRNHGDHKTVMVFAAEGSDQPGQNRPKETVVLGDAVYLRWELPGGVVQEDSLLFVGEGRRLEGSFVNSTGSWGNITGKRVQACKTP